MCFPPSCQPNIDSLMANSPSIVLCLFNQAGSYKHSYPMHICKKCSQFLENHTLTFNVANNTTNINKGSQMKVCAFESAKCHQKM